MSSFTNHVFSFQPQAFLGLLFFFLFSFFFLFFFFSFSFLFLFQVTNGTALIQFFGLQLDRGNLSNTLADNFLDDLGLTTDDYNNVSEPTMAARMPLFENCYY